MVLFGLVQRPLDGRLDKGPICVVCERLGYRGGRPSRGGGGGSGGMRRGLGDRGLANDGERPVDHDQHESVQDGHDLSSAASLDRGTTLDYLKMTPDRGKISPRDA